MWKPYPLLKRIGHVAAVYGMLAMAGNGAAIANEATAAQLRVGTVKNFVTRAVPKPLPHVQFFDAANNPHAFDEYAGKVILVNFWASWCAPCRREMPSLDRLQADLGSEQFEVVLINLDRSGYDKASAFLEQIEMQHLDSFIDPGNKSARTLGALGLPTTLLLNRKGDEIGRLAGPAEWDAPEAKALIRAHLNAR